MYQDYFGLTDLPFRVTPEPQFLFRNSAYQKAYAALRDGIDARHRVIVITGEIGTGKTTLLTLFLQTHLDPALKSAVILNPNFSFFELLRFVLHDLGIPCSSNDETELRNRLDDYVAQAAARGHRIALFVDEAQTLSVDVLEELLRFSNRVSHEDKLVQVILIGQPELDQKLHHPKLLELKRQVSVYQKLKPLSPEEVRDYIEVRLSKAGYQGKQLFDPGAIDKITLYSAGIPRLINTICDNALLIAFAVSRKKISAAIIDEVAQDLHLEAVSAARPSLDPGSRSPVQSERTITPKQLGKFFNPKLLRQAYASRSFAAIGLGILLVFGFLSGASSVLYHQGSNLVSSMASGVGYLFRANANTPVPVQSRPPERDNTQEIMPDFGRLKMEVTRILAKNKERNPASANVPAIDDSKNTKDPQPAVASRMPAHEDEIAPPPKKSRVLPMHGDLKPRTAEPTQRARGPQYWPHNESTGARPRRADREQHFFQGLFEVTADSLVFDQPQMESALVKTLRPGNRVRVEQKRGNFLLVRSMKDPELVGYVHLNEAYFRRIQ